MGTACYAGALMLQALGLGGWMYTGLNPFSVLGASGDPAVPGLGFRFEHARGQAAAASSPACPASSRRTVPPHHADMRAAVEAVVARKFGAGGPFDPRQGGPYKENAAVRGAAAPIDAEAVEIVVTDGRLRLHDLRALPGDGAGGLRLKTYLQAHQLDTEFYDQHFAPGAYLRTHAEHDRNWG